MLLYIPRLKDLREDHDLAQKQVAALYGISRSYVSRIEKKALGKLEEALRGRV